jgi:hypothetical protein
MRPHQGTNAAPDSRSRSLHSWKGEIAYGARALRRRSAPVETPGELLARVAMSRWPIETELEEEKSQVALDEYEVRSWGGWHHHMTMSMLASAFLLTLQQEWGKKGPRITRPQVYRIVYELLPRKRWTPAELLRWLTETQERNERPKRSHAKRRAKLKTLISSL